MYRCGCALWFLLFSFSWSHSAPAYRLNHQYFQAPHIAAQTTIEIHYFFSFQCPGCSRLYPILEPYFQNHKNAPVFLHALAVNQAGIQLIKAYEILKSYPQGPLYIRALYQAPMKTTLSDQDVIQLFKKEQPLNFEEQWLVLDEHVIHAKMNQDLSYAKDFQLRSLPAIYIVGPHGGFYIQPSPDLSIDKIPGCIEAVISLQEAPSQLQGI